MLRMAHRIATSQITSAWDHQWDSVRASGVRSEGNRIRKCVTESTVIVADNVNDYVVEHLTYELDNCRIPFEKCFVEWVCSKSETRGELMAMEGVIFERIDISNKTLSHVVGIDAAAAEYYASSEEVWLACPFVFLSGQSDATWSGVFVMVFIMKESRTWKAVTACITNNQQQHSWLRTEKGMVEQFHPIAIAMTVFAFMNCKNVIRRDETESLAPSAKWIRRQKAPQIKYHVLDINPMKEVLRTEGGIEENGLKKALHICRGHFATYTEEKPLFGHFVGTVWVPAHVRGRVENGLVLKDYRVNSAVVGDVK